MSSPLDLLPQLLAGAAVTVQLTLLGAVVAAFFSLVAGLARLSSNRAVRAIAAVYVEIFRGTSAIVQIFFFFYVLPITGLSLPAFLTGVFALGINVGAYGSEVVRAAILNVDRGQRDAAVALNLTRAATMRLVILPQALVAMLPPFGNLLIELLKGTSLVSLITITELTFAGKLLLRAEGRRDEIYVLVLLLYFVMALPITWSVRWAERRLSRGLHLGRTG
ncbi:MAG: ectoine/hydroxyectoine ABC transporter permease subunit EhuC [Chloroflexi bacterium]|nr:ectoine/hydroxyectoine ABC transporter permease subunit EhuC [Chloroflexota bacterium]